MGLHEHAKKWSQEKWKNKLALVCGKQNDELRSKNNFLGLKSRLGDKLGDLATWIDSVASTQTQAYLIYSHL